MKTLAEKLEEWQVEPPGDWNPPSQQGWYGVSNEIEIVAVFEHEKDACAFRLMRINMEMSEPWKMRKRPLQKNFQKL